MIVTLKQETPTFDVFVGAKRVGKIAANGHNWCGARVWDEGSSEHHWIGAFRTLQQAAKAILKRKGYVGHRETLDRVTVKRATGIR